MEDLLDPDEHLHNAPVNKPVLFVLHTIAIFCLVYFGSVLARLVFLPVGPPKWEHLSSDEIQQIGDATMRYGRAILIITVFCLLLGTAMSIFIGKLYKAGVLLSFGALGLNILLIVVMENARLIGYFSYLTPGFYIRKQAGVKLAGVVDMIYLLVIVFFLFSKHTRRWLVKA